MTTWFCSSAINIDRGYLTHTVTQMTQRSKHFFLIPSNYGKWMIQCSVPPNGGGGADRLEDVQCLANVSILGLQKLGQPPTVISETHVQHSLKSNLNSWVRVLGDLHGWWGIRLFFILLLVLFVIFRIGNLRPFCRWQLRVEDTSIGGAI